jgi:4-carboxymuconolactone decarboxylase
VPTDAEPNPLRQQIGSFAPKIVDLTEQVLFGDVWERPGLSKRDRSLVTIASLTTAGNWEQLRPHLQIGRSNGLTEAEITEAFTHLAFYAGWPKALSALTIAKEVFNQ